MKRAISVYGVLKVDIENKKERLLAATLEAIIFENWLRFYFIEENPEQECKDGEEFYYKIPHDRLEAIKRLYPDKHALSESLNGKAINFQNSRNAIIQHLLLDENGAPATEAPEEAFADADLDKRLHLFYVWLDLHEIQLDADFLEYGQWLELYRDWLCKRRKEDFSGKS